MKIVRILSVIGLASFLVLQGLDYLSETTSPMFNTVVGFVGLASGALMFVSLSHWTNPKKEQ